MVTAATSESGKLVAKNSLISILKTPSATLLILTFFTSPLGSERYSTKLEIALPLGLVIKVGVGAVKI